MQTREERAAGLFSGGYNCAQAVLGVFCEDMGLDLSTALKLASGFGGGVRSGELCGAVSGAVMAIGLKCGFYIEKDFRRKNYCNKKTYEFIERFKEENGSVLCRELLSADLGDNGGHTAGESGNSHKALCPKIVTGAVRILEGMQLT
jgi:C_GCAxxG_C_C family probable redox protein